MERLIKAAFTFGFLLFFSLTYFEPLKHAPIRIYLWLVWLSILIFAMSGIASVYVLRGYMKTKDRKGALGILITILVFSLLIGLLAFHMPASIHPM